MNYYTVIRLTKDGKMKALLVVDVQENFIARNLFQKEIFISSVNSAIRQCRNKDIPIIFIQHNNNFLKSGESGWQIYSGLDKKKSDPVIQKTHSDAFQEKELAALISRKGINEIIVCGLVSHGCIKHTCQGGIKNGLSVKLLKNGHTLWGKDAEARVKQTESELVKENVHIIETIE